MAERFRIKKGDQVIVTTGQHKGKKGEVLQVLREERRVLVKGVNVVKRHLRPTPANPDGVLEKELPLHISNVAHIDPETSKPTRVAVKLVDGKKVRIAKRSGKQIN
ncbi:MAG: 50S ribosomal protein L24 [Alphaproteobacteria bacterium]